MMTTNSHAVKCQFVQNAPMAIMSMHKANASSVNRHVQAALQQAINHAHRTLKAILLRELYALFQKNVKITLTVISTILMEPSITNSLNHSQLNSIVFQIQEAVVPLN